MIMNTIFANSRLRVSKNTIIHIRRHLPFSKGEISVKVGDEIVPEGILGEGESPTGFRTINIARELSVSPKQAFSLLQTKVGKTIFKGELLAKVDGLLGFKKKNLLCPEDAEVQFYDEKTGSVILKFLTKKTKLVSGAYGIVDAIDKEKGVVLIKTMASIVYGVFGSGKEREGILKILDTSEALVGSRQITPDMHSQIIVGGSVVFLDALEKAVSLGVKGIISGGINAGDLKKLKGSWNICDKIWNDVGLSLLVTEGFGAIPIGEDIFQILKSSDRKFVLIDGNRSCLVLPTDDKESMMYIRKTVLPVSPDFTKETAGEIIEQRVEALELRVGVKVRVVTPFLIGVQGVVESIDQIPSRLPSGIMTFMVTVITDKRKLRVPYLNLETISQ